jgi:hypothetical protein
MVIQIINGKYPESLLGATGSKRRKITFEIVVNKK